MNYAVLIEWDGSKPPTKFYRRIHTWGLEVGRTKEKSESPLERRAKYSREDVAFVFQEGCVICKSEQFARRVYMLALEMGAKTASWGKMFTEEFVLTKEDAEIFNRTEDACGRRGRRPKEDTHPWIVTCHECAATYIKGEAAYCVACPECGSGRIKTRPGDAVESYKYPENTGLLDAWKRLRFTRGEFEVCPTTGDSEPPAEVNVTNKDESRTIALIAANPEFVDHASRLPRHIAMQVVDAAFLSRTYMSTDARTEARMRTCMLLFQKGVTPDKVALLEDPLKFDLIDCAAIMGEDQAAKAWMEANNVR
jgi:hypothetical protein